MGCGLNFSQNQGYAAPATLQYRESGLTPNQGTWSVGLFNPLKIQFAQKWGVETHPLITLLSAPHFTINHEWHKTSTWTLSGLYGLSTPSLSLSPAMPLGLMGFMGPSCLVKEAEPNRAPDSCQQGGFGLVMTLGMRLSGIVQKGVWTFEISGAYGAMLSGERPATLNTYVPLEMLYAPLTDQYRIKIGGRWAQKLGKSWSWASELDLYLTGVSYPHMEVSPLTLKIYTGFDYQWTQSFFTTLGIAYWNSDTREALFEKGPDGFNTKTFVRSHQFWPTFDLFWVY